MLSWFRNKSPRNSGTPLQEPLLDKEPLANQTPNYCGVCNPERWAQIEYAFTSGGVNYFKFNTEVNIPFQRAIAARDILTEELWQIDPTVLKGWTESLINAITNPKLSSEKKLYEVGILASRLKEQMELSFSLTRQLKLATVVYFDERENPLDYEYPYNKQKIEHWTKHNDVEGFFLNLPQYLYLPSGNELTQSFPTYLQAETVNLTNLLKHITTSLPSDGSSSDLKTALLGQMETLKIINSWSKDPSTSIT
jgi:hypothetical protein